MSENFFEEAFDGYTVPKNLRKASETICNRFNIKGICDPMYIVNVIAYHTGLGDGQGVFYELDATNVNISELADKLTHSYGSNIDSPKEVELILVNTL